MTEDEDAGYRLRRWRERGTRLVRNILDHPMRALVPLAFLALAVELAQYREEIVPGGHAIGELVRNLAYALIGALIFNWLIVEIPARRRRRAAYEYHKLDFETLLTVGPACIAQYRHFNPPGAPELDSWDKKSVWGCAKRTAEHQPLHFGPQRAQLLAVSIQGVQMTLDGMRSSTFFFDSDVAHALALFPRHGRRSPVADHAGQQGLHPVAAGRPHRVGASRSQPPTLSGPPSARSRHLVQHRSRDTDGRDELILARVGSPSVGVTAPERV